MDMQYKKTAAAALAGITLFALPAGNLGIGASAAANAALTHLLKSLTSAGSMTAADDYNSDGKVNAVDLTLMKRDLLAAQSSGTLTEQTVALTDSNVKRVGRTLTKDGITWLVQSGSAVECTVTGTEASITIHGDGCVYSDEKYRPRYGVWVDGELVADVVMDTPQQTVTLFSGSTQRTASVKVMHLSEANNGAVGVSTVEVTSSAAQPVKPAAKKDLTIEFIGDSITCAYGVEADSQYVSFSTATENFSLSYAYLTAQLLNADYSAVCYSGYGIVSGYSNDGTINTSSLVPPIYTQTGSLSDYTAAWDFDANPVDAVVINLGTNDDSYATKDLETRGKEYQAAYTEFLGTVREKNPDAVIVCTLGIMGCQELYPYLEAAVADCNDSKITCYESPTHDFQNNGIGADWHPSAKTHELNSYLLASHLSDALGIEYSGVGLDYAADAVFSLETVEGSGANAWPYYSEWDNSFNVNISAGGGSDDDMVIWLRGMDLTAGEYELSFTTNPPEDAKLPYVLCDADGNPLCKGTVTGTGDSQTVTQTLRVSVPEDGCALALSVGSLSTGNIWLKGVTLYKLSE